MRNQAASANDLISAAKQLPQTLVVAMAIAFMILPAPPLDGFVPEVGGFAFADDDTSGNEDNDGDSGDDSGGTPPPGPKALCARASGTLGVLATSFGLMAWATGASVIFAPAMPIFAAAAVVTAFLTAAKSASCAYIK